MIKNICCILSIFIKNLLYFEQHIRFCYTFAPQLGFFCQRGRGYLHQPLAFIIRIYT